MRTNSHTNETNPFLHVVGPLPAGGPPGEHFRRVAMWSSTSVALAVVSFCGLTAPPRATLPPPPALRAVGPRACAAARVRAVARRDVRERRAAFDAFACTSAHERSLAEAASAFARRASAAAEAVTAPAPAQEQGQDGHATVTASVAGGARLGRAVFSRDCGAGGDNAHGRGAWRAAHNAAARDQHGRRDICHHRRSLA